MTATAKSLFARVVVPLSLLCAAGCSSPAPDTSSVANSGKQTSRGKRTAGANLPPVAKESAALAPSQVEVSAPGTSEAGAAAIGSQVVSKQVATSEARVEQILSEFNARRTDEGIIINLPENILFDFDKADLKPEATPTLQKITELLGHYSDAPVQIHGHTDSKGGDDYNQSLSERRANSVKDYLVKNGQVSGGRLQAAGFGETKPVAPNARPDGSDDPEGRQKNRRVEVIIKNS